MRRLYGKSTVGIIRYVNDFQDIRHGFIGIGHDGNGFNCRKRVVFERIVKFLFSVNCFQRFGIIFVRKIIDARVTLYISEVFSVFILPTQKVVALLHGRRERKELREGRND